MAQEVVQHALSIEQRIQHWTNPDRLVDLNKVHSLLQLKLSLSKDNSKRVDSTLKHISTPFNWEVLREELLKSTERLTFNIESIYQFGYQYLSGNSVLKADAYESVFLDIKITMNRLETAYLMAALWVGSQEWNANGKLLTGLYRIIQEARNLISKLTTSSEQQKQPKENKTKFQTLVSMVMAKSGQQMFKSVNDPKSKELKLQASKFIQCVDYALKIVESIDESINTTNQYKTASEVALVLHLFEGFNHVRFDKQSLEEAYKFIPGRASNFLSQEECNSRKLPSQPSGPLFTSDTTLNRLSLAPESRNSLKQGLRVSGKRSVSQVV